MTKAQDDELQAFSGRLNSALTDAGYPEGRGRASALQKRLAQAGIDLSDRGIGKWLKGQGMPDTKKLPAMAAALGVRAEWLLSGNEPRKAAPGSTVKGAFHSAVKDWESEEELDERAEVAIPVMDISLSAGIGRTVFEFIDTLQKLAFSRAFLRRKQARPEDCVVMDVRGDSMWPTLSDGDHVLINRADTRIIDGRIYALIVGGEAKIKRLRKMYHGGLAVISDNRSYGEEEVPPEGMEHVTIIGRALQRSGEL